MRVLFILSIVLIFFHSCQSNSSGCIKLKLSEDERFWFNSYEIGDTILFRSKIVVDTFVVGQKSSLFTSCNRFELGDYQFERNSLGLYKVQNTNKQRKNSDVVMRFSKDYQTSNNEPCLKEFYFFDLRSNDYFDGQVFKNEKINFSDTLIGTLKFEYGYSLKDYNSGQTFYKSFNWSREHGLVRYTLSSGNVYDFWKKI